MLPATLIAYFSEGQAAHEAIRRLGRAGYPRAAGIARAADGKIRRFSPFFRRRILGAVAAFALFGALAFLAALAGLQLTGDVAPSVAPLLALWLPTFGLSGPVLAAMAGGLTGALLSLVWIRRSRHGVEQQILGDHSRLLAAGETAVVVRAPTSGLRAAVTCLLECGESPPAVFVVRPERPPPNVEHGNLILRRPAPGGGPLTEHARRLAEQHELDHRRPRSAPFLESLERQRRWIQQVCVDLGEAVHVGQAVPASAEWLLDNEYILESNARDVRLNLPQAYYRQLPVLAGATDVGVPRVYSLVRELVTQSELLLESESILTFIEAYQETEPLSIGELWALPQIIRTVLIEAIGILAGRALTELRESEAAAFWANRLIAKNRSKPNQLFAAMADLTDARPAPSLYFATQLIEYLHDGGAALTPVQGWLEQVFEKPLNDLVLGVKRRQTENQVSIGKAVTSLRRLALLDWKHSFEHLSRVEQALRRDPAGVYPGMDFGTRDRYRRAVEDMARGSGLAEERVAGRVVEMAAAAGSTFPPDEGLDHVGTYLLGHKKTELARSIGSREALRSRVLSWAHRHHSAVYFLGLAFLAGLFTVVVAAFGLRPHGLTLQLISAALVLIPVSQLALEVVNTLIMRVFPPRVLAKMDFKDTGIPDAYRTLVVVPMLLNDVEAIGAEVEKLEIRYLANTDPNLLFALYTDYHDADTAVCDTDSALLLTAEDGIARLNARYGGERFFLLHRNRVWSDSEQKFIGWERKRGKLEELNELISGARPRDAERLVKVGDENRLSDVRFVITLDSDTQLPAMSARRMVETLAHPLNHARIEDDGVVRSGYTIIQPRVSPSLPSASGSPFSRLFADAVGTDPYTNTVSDAYQDLAGAGSYHGKGIYDAHTFNRVLSGRFPEAHLLSHDLLEGAYVRVGLASDIELYDEFPQDYLSYVKRQHRWIRGDWQIADWVMPRVPRPTGGRAPNPLSWFDRWKILDNLRRSALPVASITLLVVTWLISPRAALVGGAVVGVQLLYHSLMQPLTWLTSRRAAKDISIEKVSRNLLRVLFEAALLPYHAWLAVDAACKVWYRRISHRGLLDWSSTADTTGTAQRKVSAFVASVGVATAFALIVGAATAYLRPDSLGFAAPWLLLWLLSPILAGLLCRRPAPKTAQSRIGDKDRRFLRSVARRTWRYFAEFVNGETSWLPPDNYQVSHNTGVALRTSPTNIGLYMMSAIAAHEFGYLTGDEVVESLNRTVRTIAKLERYEGHLLNWYSIQSLEPLNPRYVSTVDSGNLLGALWGVERGIDRLINEPLLDERALHGLHDTADTLRRIANGGGPAEPAHYGLDRLLQECESPPHAAAEILAALRKLGDTPDHVWERNSTRGSEQDNAGYWAGELRRQLAAWLRIADRYLSWSEILAEKTEEEIAGVAPDALPEFRQALLRAPSLQQLAGGKVAGITALEKIRARIDTDDGALLEWVDRVRAAFERAQWLAGEVLADAGSLSGAIEELAGSINMRFLYSSERRLFSVGFSVSEGRLDHVYYDLLASEARFGSFVAIARGDVPVEHWFAMNRPYGLIGRRRVLLSWSGTMFEYLMPLLFQRSYDNALLDKAARESVAIQIAYGRKHQVPWGVSESAYADLDLRKTYQYHAFGVPELGLRRGLAEKVVVAPYASLLAVSIAPRETVRNLKRLAELGLLSEYGYYEALDFSRRPSHGAPTGVVVRAYMAHHHGMSLLALSNFLHDDWLRLRFHSDPRVRAAEPLLHERIPRVPPLHHVTTRERIVSVVGAGDAAGSISQFETPHSPTPKTQLLSNGRYAVMISSAGGGYSRWGDIAITRWRSDVTADSWGTFCYLHDTDSGQLWSSTYQPTAGETSQFRVTFTPDRAVFRRFDRDIETETEIIVAPDDDVEIRRVTLVNRGAATRRLELTSYAELAMAPHVADRQHPAFNKLFIQTEALPDEKALLAWRRPRSASDVSVYVGHRLTPQRSQERDWVEAGNGDQPTGAALRFETDRQRFIGRGRTLARPMGAVGEPTGGRGFVLDPVLSLRRSLILAPGDRQQVSMIVAAGPSAEQVVGLMRKYADPAAIDNAMESAWTAAQLELRLLRLQPDQARRLQQLASHLLYPNLLLRAAPKEISVNRKGQSGLWAYGISGDLPIALISIADIRDIAVVRQMLQAHAYWRLNGLVADLVILNEEAAGYAQPLRDELEHLIQANSEHTGVDQPGGIFLRSAEAIPASDITLLRAVAVVALVAARGSLAKQLAVSMSEAVLLPNQVTQKRDAGDPSAALAFMDLPFFNSLGGFTPDGSEYVIYLGPDIHTPAPWTNVIANPEFGTIVSETGSGFTWQGNSQRNRLTSWSNDATLDPSSEAIYIRDEDTGVYWSPTAAPIREQDAYRARHGAGYTVFEHNSHGIEQELTVFVPMDTRGGEPVKLQQLALFNDTDRPRTLSLFFYVEWTLGESRESSQTQVVTSWDDEHQAMLARNSYHPDYGDCIAFAALSAAVLSYTADRTEFLGRNGTMERPAALGRSGLSRRTGAGLDPCSALQTTVELGAGERVRLTCILGETQLLEHAQTLVKQYRDSLATEAALARTRGWWDERLRAIQVQTPEQATDFMVNRWLLYQTLSCRVWGRSGFYQSGGAFGFRDQLQDVTALLYADPPLAREHILRAAGRQFKEGDVQHWWHPPGGGGIRSRISDDLLWLPYAVAQYVRITGDAGVLHEVVPFLDGPPLDDDMHESYQSPDLSSEEGTIYEHCRRALARSQRYGEHGLPLMGGGDWNDGMNLVGIEGRGESVWLAWFMVVVTAHMAELSDLLGERENARDYRRERNALIECIENFAWDGEWYLRATFDDGTLLGGSANSEAHIDLLPQAWAWLSGVAEPARAEAALESAWNHLVREDEALVQLFDPPFDRFEPSPGYIKGYPPGVRENGGQYTHAALWLAMAMARSGDGTRAAQLLRMLNPVEHARDPEAVWRYGTEPYVVAADVYRLPGRVGQGGWSWYTGSAAWMYRAWVEEVLGLTVRGETMRISPVVPAWWDGFRMSFRHGEAVYDIEVTNPEHREHGVDWVELDGRRVAEGVILLDRSRVKHRVVVRMGLATAPGDQAPVA